MRIVFYWIFWFELRETVISVTNLSGLWHYDRVSLYGMHCVLRWYELFGIIIRMVVESSSQLFCWSNYFPGSKKSTVQDTADKKKSISEMVFAIKNLLSPLQNYRITYDLLQITNSINDSQLLSPITAYSKNVFTGVMDQIEWLKSSTYDKGVAPIRELWSGKGNFFILVVFAILLNCNFILPFTRLWILQKTHQMLLQRSMKLNLLETALLEKVSILLQLFHAALKFS